MELRRNQSNLPLRRQALVAIIKFLDRLRGNRASRQAALPVLPLSSEPYEETSLILSFSPWFVELIFPAAAGSIEWFHVENVSLVGSH